MPIAKTVLTLEEDLLMELGRLAVKFRLLPNELIAQALTELVQREQNREITQRINDAYAGELTEEEWAEEQALRRFSQASTRRLAEKDPW